ncbi:MAG: glutathione S-transferase [Pseudomonadales bacterium]|nr:glutathione S-transferase [Pseudomonadales bacterium]
MLTIYHAPGTRSIRPIWLCFELGLEIDIRTVSFTPEFLASPEWRAISPAGKLPLLQDGDLTMFESGAMMEYILDACGGGRLRPAPGTHESALHHQWSWFSESTLARPLGIARMMRGGDLAGDLGEKVSTCLAVVDEAVQDKSFLLGETFYSADIMMGYTLELLRRFDLLDDRFPNALRYLEQLKSRDACQRAMAA